MGTFLTLMALFFANHLQAAETVKVAKQQPNSANSTHIWTFGLGSIFHRLQAYGDNDLAGTSATIDIGYGIVKEKWFLRGAFSSILGPYEPARDHQFNMDYFGTGFLLLAGAQLQNFPYQNFKFDKFEDRSLDYGLAFGFYYFDLSGKSIGKNRRIDNDSSVAPRDYRSNITNLALLPSFFVSWLTPSRQAGNTPEDLKTRVEGYQLIVGAVIPVMSYYDNQYSKDSLQDDGSNMSVVIRERGSFTGASAYVALSILLGI